MKKIFLKKDNIVFCLRGIPGSGKSTWLKSQGLLDYTISPDSFRLMLSNPVYNQETQQEEINQAVSSKAWEMTYDCLKSRCRYGGVTFVDATFMHPKALASLKEIVPRDYKIVVIDFTKIGLAEAHRRNEKRKGTFRYVPPFVLDRMWESGKAMTFEGEGVEKYDFDEVIVK